MNIEEIFKKLSDSAKPKFDIVTGKVTTDAKIAGITPAVLIFKGKCEDHHRTFYYLLVFLDN